ncbi:uncharacterized protein LOC106180606 isoform X4 [Lingula anatina]|uniref:Uncharacterized protein LOC106180606 isoform X4 n=1 Tax=Lingula anatina TaxID=7574 RepID=A0A1S3KCV6_LINAN|nr:uncharacterized protein LOC106180606 isoform X4 [Lingula anatina]|eukprot:XP_013420081.2 uncharacterized protein LOC106180606 isoform X4 [Lingula anatina]
MTFLIHKAVYFIWLCQVMYSTGDSSSCICNIPVNCSEPAYTDLFEILRDYQSLFIESPPNFYNVPQECSVNCSVLPTPQTSTDGLLIDFRVLPNISLRGNGPNSWLLGVVFGCIGLCCLVAIIVVIYFKKKGKKLRFRVGPGCHDNNNFLHNFQIRGHKYIQKKSKHGNDYAMTTDLSGSQALTPVEGRENFYENANVIDEKNVPNGKTPPSSPKGRKSTSRPLKTAVPKTALPSVSAGVEKTAPADLSGSQAPTYEEGRQNIYENANDIDEKNVPNGKTPPQSPKGRNITSRPLKTAVPSVSASVEETPNQNTFSSADAHPAEHQPQSVPPLSHQWNKNNNGLDVYNNQINHENKIPLQDSSAEPKKKERKKKKSVKAVQKPRPLPPAPHIP